MSISNESMQNSRVKSQDTPLHDASQIKIDGSAVSLRGVVYKGDVTVGSGTFIHPNVQILAHHGAIRIGSNCIIEEQVIIENSEGSTLSIGDSNHFEVGAHIEASVGSYNTFGVKCYVNKDVIVTDNCAIGPATKLFSLTDGIEKIPPFTVTYGTASNRRIWDGSGQVQELAMREIHLQYLREVVPRFHKPRRAA